jgi:hypothetical protein
LPSVGTTFGNICKPSSGLTSTISTFDGRFMSAMLGRA